MAKKIMWSLKAQQDRKEILTYWIKRNKSKTYSNKLNQLFKNTVNLISYFPNIGKKTNVKGTRIKIVRDYFLVYEVEETSIYILAIWDTRQNPAKLERIIK